MNYRIAENFRGENPHEFHGFRVTCDMPYPLVIGFCILQKFYPQNGPFYQSAKLFSLESFALYGKLCVYLLTSQWDSVCVLKLIQAGDINTDLILACQWGEVERAKVLLEYGADINFQNSVKNISMLPVIVQ